MPREVVKLLFWEGCPFLCQCLTTRKICLNWISFCDFLIVMTSWHLAEFLSLTCYCPWMEQRYNSLHDNWHCLYSDLFIIVLLFFPGHIFKLLLVFCVLLTWLMFCSSFCISFLKRLTGAKTGAVSKVASSWINHPIIKWI